MPSITKIEWTGTYSPDGIVLHSGYSSNPIYAIRKSDGKRGWHCVHASPGCEKCYSETLNKRFGTGLSFTANNDSKIEFVLNEKEVEAIRNFKKSGKVFIGDMMDLWHKDVPQGYVYSVMKAVEDNPRLIGQFLTKRPERLLEFQQQYYPQGLPENVWVGASVEDQRRANERIPVLFSVKAVIRFLSVEPQLDAVNLRRVFPPQVKSEPGAIVPCFPIDELDCLSGNYFRGRIGCEGGRRISWVIIGGESGPGARPFNLQWARQIVEDCRRAKIPVFMKQIGSNPICFGELPVEIRDGKGGDMRDWPEWLKVREFPKAGGNSRNG